MAETFTYERAASELSDAMDAAIKRLETIQETHPDIALDDDLPRYREAQAQFRRIPSLSQREKQWNTRSDQSARIADLEAALEDLQSRYEYRLRSYEEIGPNWTMSDGRGYEEAEAVANLWRDDAALIRTALQKEDRNDG